MIDSLPQSEQEEEWLTAKQAAQRLRISQVSVYNANTRGKFPGSQKRGGVWVFPASEVSSYQIDSRIRPPGDVLTEEEHVSPVIISLPKQPTTRYAIERQPDEAQPDEEFAECHRCQRVFTNSREYTIKRFVYNRKPEWHPVCRDGRCDPTLVNARLLYQQQQEAIRDKKRSNQLLAFLKGVRKVLDDEIAKYEERPPATTTDVNGGE